MKMKGTYYSKKFPALISSLILLVFIFLGLKFSVWGKFGIVSLGMLLGVIWGFFSWKRQEKRIGRTNFLVVFFSESAIFSLIFFVGILSLFPRLSFRLAVFSIFNATEVVVLLLFVLSVSFGYIFCQLLFIRKYEYQNGPIRIKEFYSKSVTGQEGMIGKIGEVLKNKGVEGQGRIGPEFWTIRTIDGERLSSGDSFTVRDVEGNILIVEGKGGLTGR